VILDVRTQSEWDSGHIAGATLAENLATFGTSSHQGASPDDMIGCEFCSIAVYCRKLLDNPSLLEFE
jgi:rhodanese-related sulfurtransferase